MLVQNWNDLAVVLANFARDKLATVMRGSMMIPIPADHGVFVVVFGNARHEPGGRTPLELIRQRLWQSPYRELGFGLSEDGCSWAFLLHAPYQPYETAAGQQFQKEMLRSFIDEALETDRSGGPFLQVLESCLGRAG